MTHSRKRQFSHTVASPYTDELERLVKNPDAKDEKNNLIFTSFAKNKTTSVAEE